MASIAIIGPDGAGKTTLARKLERSSLLPFRYIYMGVDLSASNIALPTSRLFQQWKAQQQSAEHVRRAAGSPHRPLRSTARGIVRLLALVTEEWFRQLVSWYYQLQGYTVLYDRHFVFDFAPELAPAHREPLDRRLHRWFLRFLYPRPGLVLFLDAPGELLFARKGDSNPQELERRRQALLRLGSTMRQFRRIDATRPLAEVYAEVTEHVLAFVAPRQKPVSARALD